VIFPNIIGIYARIPFTEKDFTYSKFSHILMMNTTFIITSTAVFRPEVLRQVGQDFVPHRLIRSIPIHVPELWLPCLSQLFSCIWQWSLWRGSCLATPCSEQEEEEQKRNRKNFTYPELWPLLQILTMFKTTHLGISKFDFLLLCPFRIKNLNEISILPLKTVLFWEQCDFGVRNKIGIAKNFLHGRAK
jgi:hypothetical protein